MDWIVIPRWDGPGGFQHYKDRDPIWIRTYTRLLADDTYRNLTGHQRAVLHGLWLAYASSGRQLRVDTASLTRRLGLRVSSHTLKSLSDAGFIQLVGSNPVRAKQKQQQQQKVLPAVTAVSSYDSAAAAAKHTHPETREITPDIAGRIAKLRGADKKIGAVIASFKQRGLPEAAFRNALEATAEAAAAGRVHGTEVAYFVGTLRKMEADGQYP